MAGRSVVIVGGGIGGLSAAVALRSRGAQVQVYEQAHQFGEVGAGDRSSRMRLVSLDVYTTALSDLATYHVLLTCAIIRGLI